MTFTDKLQANGFTYTAHSEAFDRGTLRVYFGDGCLHVIQFNNTTARLVETRSQLDFALGDDTLLAILAAFPS